MTLAKARALAAAHPLLHSRKTLPRHSLKPTLEGVTMAGNDLGGLLDGLLGGGGQGGSGGSGAGNILGPLLGALGGGDGQAADGIWAVCWRCSPSRA